MNSGMPQLLRHPERVAGAIGAHDLYECQRLAMSVQYCEVRAAPAADWGGLLLLHHHIPGSSQQVVTVRVHSLARPQDLLGRVAVPPAMRGGVAASGLPELA